MKKIINSFYMLLAAMLMVSTFWACTFGAEELPQATGNNGELVVNLRTSSGNQLRTRGAIVNVNTDNEAVVKNMVVGIFKSDGTQAKIEKYTATELGTDPSANGLQQNVSTSYTNSDQATKKIELDDKVLVAINVPDARLNEFTASTLTYTTFKQKQLTAAEAITHTATGTTIAEDALPMWGEGVVAANGATFKADVTVVRMVAKVTLASLTADFSETLRTGAKFKLTELFLLNVPNKADCNFAWDSTTGYTYQFLTSEAVPTEFSTGEANITKADGTEEPLTVDPDNFPTQAVSAQKHLAEYVGSGALTVEPITTGSSAISGYTFYTIANNSATYNTKLIIKGKYTDDETLEPVATKGHDAYYAIDLYPDKATDANNKNILPNYNYSVSAVIKGDGADNAYLALPKSESVKSTVTTLPFDDYQNTVIFNGGITQEALPPAKVGDLYYSDGTWGPYSAENAAKTPIGIVFSTNITSADYQAGYHHGYVMALKRANNGSNVANWCANISSLQSTLITRTTPTEFFSPVTDLMNDMEGLTYCKNAEKYCTDNGIDVSNLTAIQAAKNFGTEYEGKYAAPAGTSGWYLPSIGQQYQWLKNLANAGAAKEGSTTYTGAESWTNNSSYWTRSSESSGAASAINSYCQAKLAAFYTNDNSVFENFAQGHYLWSSTERISSHPFNLCFNTDGNLHLNGSYDKSDTNRRVRAVLAF